MPSKSSIIIPGSRGSLAIKVSRLSGMPLGYIQVERLPDGEKYVRVPEEVDGRKVFFFNSLAFQPDELIVETIFAVDTLRELGAEKIVGVFPYFPYSRREAARIKGEASSLYTVARMMRNAGVDAMITVDFHYQRQDLSELFGFPVVNLTAMKELSAEISELGLENPLIVGPDEESIRWVSVVAEELNTDYTLLKKIRVDAENVVITSAPRNVGGRDVVIVDDMISTGATVIQAVKALKRAGCGRVYVTCTHAVIGEETLQQILERGVEDVIATDTVLTSLSRVSVAPLIAEAIGELE